MKSKINYIANIANNKVIFSGIAIMMILLYHQPKNSAISGLYFYPGFAGVDIFLFFSGLGLGYSFNNNCLGEFYKRRFIRILPLFMLLGLVVGLHHYKEHNLWDYICNMTSLSYWGLGGEQYEWYLSSLFILYLTFPILYKVIAKWPSRYFWWGVLLTSWIIIFSVFATVDLKWYYETFIGRVPIFLLGIMCYMDKDFFKYGPIIFLSFLIPAIFLYIRGYIHTYTLIYCLGPFIIMTIALIVPYVNSMEILSKGFSWAGKRSLEIYVANCIIKTLLGGFFTGWVLTIVYWLSHLLVVPIVCWINS